MSGKRIKSYLLRMDFLLAVLLGLILNGVRSLESNNYHQGKSNVPESQSEIRSSLTAQREPSTCLSVQWSDENCLIGPVSIKTDIAETAFHQLCPQPRGKYEAPSSCDLYVVCNAKLLTVNRCPASYHFNSKLQKCVEAQTYECSHKSVEDPKSILDHNSIRDRRSLMSVETDISKQKSRVDGHIMSKRSIKSNGDCPEDYIRPHPVHCNKFLICSNGKFFEQECGVGAKFNPLSKVCDLPDNVDCESRIDDLGTYDCQENYVYTTSHFLYCDKFIECDHGQLFVKTCSFNTVFNAEKNMCDFAQTTHCKKPISLEHDTDVNFLRKSRDVSNYVCEFNYIAPIEGVCDEFLECEKGKLFRKSCGPGTAYNVLIGQCDWPENVRAPDHQYCSRFLQCDGKHYVPSNCRPGTFFNPGTAQCDSPQNVDCSGKLDDPRRIPQRPPTRVSPPPRTTPRTTTYRPYINSK